MKRAKTRIVGPTGHHNRSRTGSLGPNHFQLGSQNSGYSYLSPVRCKLTTDDLFIDDLSTDLATDLATDPFISGVDSLSDAGDEEVCSSDLSSGDDASSSDGIKVFPSPSDDTSSASPSELTEDMPKVFQAPWVTRKGEAGNFVELSTRGGIMEYDAILKQRKLVFLCTI